MWSPHEQYDSVERRSAGSASEVQQRVGYAASAPLEACAPEVQQREAFAPQVLRREAYEVPAPPLQACASEVQHREA